MNFKLQCFPFHKWEEWRIKSQGVSYGDGWGNMTRLPTGSYVEQERRCENCKLVQIKRERT